MQFADGIRSVQLRHVFSVAICYVSMLSLRRYLEKLRRNSYQRQSAGR